MNRSTRRAANKSSRKSSSKIRLAILPAIALAMSPILGACGSGGNSQTLYCTDKDNRVVDDSNCSDSNGPGIAPFYYHWLYFHSGGVGRVPIGGFAPSGGSISPAPGITYKSSGGTTSSSGGISRGGFGGSSHGSSGGGS